MKARLLHCAILGAMLVAALSGCAASTRITVHSTSRTNNGDSMYMMVRSWDGKPTSGEGYQDVVGKVFVEPPDPTVLMARPIVPGEEKTTVTVDEDMAKEVVVYFFFTDPGPGWQVPLRRPLPSEVDIDLGRREVERVRTSPR